MPKGPLADGALELWLLGPPSFIPKRPFVDGALDVVLPKDPNPEKPVVLGGVPLDASLFTVPPKRFLVELAFEVRSLEDVTFKPNKPGERALNVSLLGDPPLELEKLLTVEDDSLLPNKVLLEGVWVGGSLPQSAESKLKSPSPGDTESCSASLAPVSPLSTGTVASIPVVRDAAVLAMLFPTSIVGWAKGFTAQVCGLNSSSRFLLFVSGSR